MRQRRFINDAPIHSDHILLQTHLNEKIKIRWSSIEANVESV